MRSPLAALILVLALAAAHDCAPFDVEVNSTSAVTLRVAIVCPDCTDTVNVTATQCDIEDDPDCDEMVNVTGDQPWQLWSPGDGDVTLRITTNKNSQAGEYRIAVATDDEDAVCCIIDFDNKDGELDETGCVDQPWGSCCYDSDWPLCNGGQAVNGMHCPGEPCENNDTCITGLCAGVHSDSTNTPRCCVSEMTDEVWQVTTDKCRTDYDWYCTTDGQQSYQQNNECPMQKMLCEEGEYREVNYICEPTEGCVRDVENVVKMEPDSSIEACSCMDFRWVLDRCCHDAASFIHEDLLCARGRTYSCNSTWGRVDACTTNVYDGAANWWCDRYGSLTWNEKKTLGCECELPAECATGICPDTRPLPPDPPMQDYCCAEACPSPKEVIRAEGVSCRKLSCTFMCKKFKGLCGEAPLPCEDLGEVGTDCAYAIENLGVTVPDSLCNRTDSCARAQSEAVACGKVCIKKCVCGETGWMCDADKSKPTSLKSTEAAVCSRNGWKVISVLQNRFVNLPYNTTPIRLGERIYFPFQVRNPSHAMRFVSIQVHSPSGGVQFEGKDFTAMGDRYVFDMALVPGGLRNMAIFITPLKLGFTNITIRLCDAVEKKFGCGPGQDSLDTKNLVLWSFSNVKTMVFSGRSASGLTPVPMMLLAVLAASHLVRRRREP